MKTLAVDDKSQNLDLLEVRLQCHGYDVTSALNDAEALHESKVDIEFPVARDGVEAMAFLRQQGEHASAPRPDLILLDLNIPRKDGREVLAEMKTDPELKHIPVTMLTISEADQDILLAYRLGANCYLTKSVDFEQLAKTLQAVAHFWFTIVRLPPH
jgi:two-component system response regulator